MFDPTVTEKEHTVLIHFYIPIFISWDWHSHKIWQQNTQMYSVQINACSGYFKQQKSAPCIFKD